ncbi:hypothetical protein AY600_01785 [Phormidium willei BDU 130791]|nr:hypothetical protein AY600_01785 [Phormidium willei BDU 130791]
MPIVLVLVIVHCRGHQGNGFGGGSYLKWDIVGIWVILFLQRAFRKSISFSSLMLKTWGAQDLKTSDAPAALGFV